jgi:ssDNA-binding Zn-finger/Zn-ribbon topoisomerase 1
MKIVCSSCGYIGDSVDLAKGSRQKEVLLWCCLLLPGLLYTLWRQSSDGRYEACPKCESPKLRSLKRREWKQFQKSGHVPG